MTAILGVDPGLSGAIALLDVDTGDLVGLWDMPAADGHVLGPNLGNIIRQFCVAVAWIEDVHSMPRDGVASAHRFGRAIGVVEGVLGDQSISIRRVTPAAWKKAAGIRTGADKEASRRRAIELWPAHADAFARKKDHGRAEAALVARHGWLELNRKETS